MNDSSFEAELRTTFLTEAHEMLDDVENIFMQIEQDPSDLSSMNKIMRLVHTIKGSGAIVGFKSLAEFAHKFETFIVAIRDKKIVLTTEMVDILLEGNDALKKSVSLLKKDHNIELEHLQKTEKKIEEILLSIGKTFIDKKDADEIKKQEIKQSQDKQPSKYEKRAVQDLADKKARVLVCDDEEDICESLFDILSEANYDVITLNNPEEALNIVKTRNIDIIITDFKMPGMDGILFTQNIRRFNSYIPIVLLSGNISSAHIKKMLEIGVNDFIEKPFSLNSILLVIDRALTTKRFWNQLLLISKTCFKTFVAFQKLETLSSVDSLTEDEKKERETIRNCLVELKIATAKLLEVEKSGK